MNVSGSHSLARSPPASVLASACRLESAALTSGLSSSLLGPVLRSVALRVESSRRAPLGEHEAHALCARWEARRAVVTQRWWRDRGQRTHQDGAGVVAEALPEHALAELQLAVRAEERRRRVEGYENTARNAGESEGGREKARAPVRAEVGGDDRARLQPKGRGPLRLVEGAHLLREFHVGRGSWEELGGISGGGCEDGEPLPWSWSGSQAG